ncbi:MAG: hypothetical protein ABIP55_17225, partial [Tepidisphaeraceae bacterium]
MLAFLSQVLPSSNPASTAPVSPPARITEAGAWTRGVEKLHQTGLDFVAALPNLLTAAIVFTAFFF